MDLVGRETQLATVERAVQDVRDGASRVLAVVGEPGIGKTALLAATGARARAAGLLTLEGRAAEPEREVPFALAVAANGHVRVPAAAAAAERFRYHRALRSLIELLARERPVALLLDDVHWADDASLELMLHLLRRPPREPHLLALALRSAQPAARLLQAAGPGTEYVELGPLTRADSLALLEGLADAAVRERVAREAGGNPLFLHQLARWAQLPDGTLPPCVVAGVAREIAALPDDSRALIEGAAVAGDPFGPPRRRHLREPVPRAGARAAADRAGRRRHVGQPPVRGDPRADVW